jgi:hypothetical protein
MRAALRLTLLATLLILCALQSQTAKEVEARGYNSWVLVDVMSFDGRGIVARITLKTSGNHVNSAVHIYGEFFGSTNQGQPCFPGTICVRESLSAVVGRMVREVSYSSDANLTSFQYIAKWVSTYKVSNQFFGLPAFPLDEHQLTLFIGTDFNADMDVHEKIPSLPNSNYEGFYSVKSVNATLGSPYEYEIDLQIRHPALLQLSMLIWTWGVVILLLLVTAVLALQRSHKQSDFFGIVTASWGVIVFVPIFELTLQNLEAPLGITLSDISLFLIMTANVLLSVGVLRNWQKKRYLIVLLLSVGVLVGVSILWSFVS